MKKLMFVAAAMAAGVAMADVSSANVVGYNTLTLPAQEYVMVGVQFNSVGAEGLDIQDLFPNPLEQGFTGVTSPNSAGAAYQLQYWDPEDPNKYVKLFLSTSTSGDRYGKWCLAAAPRDTSWGSGKNAISSKKLTSGMGLWLIRPDGQYATEKTVTLSGQVVIAQSGRSYTVRGDGGYTMISGGFTTDFDLNGIGYDWLGNGFIGVTSPNSAGAADQIQYWNPSTETANKYVKLFLSTSTSGGRNNKWCLAAAPTDTSWGSSKNAICNKAIPAGRGFWLIRPNGAPDLTFTLPQPYSL